MKSILAILFCLLVANLAFAQKKGNKLSLEINYGLNANFFVKSYEEINNGPANHTYLFKKNFLGTVGGAELKYNFNPYGSLLLGFSNTVNRSAKNYSGNINGVDISIRDFHVTHQNQFYQLGYDRVISKTVPSLRFNLGFVYVQMQQQEISIENFDNVVIIDERNLRNSALQEAGFFGGISFSKKIDTKLNLGIMLKGYYLATSASFEAITITPTLSYQF